MLMHFIFKFNCHDGVESGKEPTWPPARVGEPAYPLKQLLGAGHNYIRSIKV